MQITHKPWGRRGNILIQATIDGEEVGHVYFNVTEEDFAFSKDVCVVPAMRRRGIATAMYNYAKTVLPKPLAPSKDQTISGAAFWAAYGA